MQSSLSKKIVTTIIHSPIGDKIDSIALFGSYSNGTQNDNSDIDILIKLNSPVGLSFFELENQLSEKLNKKVDLVPEGGLSKYIASDVGKNKTVLYERS